MTAARTFAVKNFDRFQHYKDRSPPWIKLYNELFDDYEFSALPDALKGQLIMIWLLASRMDNCIPYDAVWVGKRIGATDPVDLDGLAERGFIVEYDAETAKGKREEWPSRYISDATKQEVLARDQGKCRQCGTTENIEFDHVIPVSKGGPSTTENLQLLCRSHNRQKRATHNGTAVPALASVAAEQVATQVRSPETEERERREEKLDEEFDLWWAHAPRKTARGQAKKAYVAARRKADQHVLLLGIQKHAAEVRGTDPKFIPHPATWLNGERWLDEGAAGTPRANGYIPMGVGG